MQVPPEITFRGVERTDALESLVYEQIDKLEKVCDHLDSCHVAVEKPIENVSNGSGYRVRVDMMVPPQHELVAARDEGDGTAGDDVALVIRETFDVARRQLRKFTEKQREQSRGQ